MKAFINCSLFFAIAVVLISCGEREQKNQVSRLEEQAMLEEVNTKIVRSFYEFMDKQDSTSLEKIIGKNFALFFGSSEEPVSYSQIKPLIKGVYFAFPFSREPCRFRYATQNGWVDPAHDLLPGAGQEWFTIQQWLAVETTRCVAGFVSADATRF